jgi:hypothetical protein
VRTRVIFLDIDGVLAPIPDASHYGDLERTCVETLNDLVARSGADVVVSSSLRFGKTVPELQALLDNCGFMGHVVGKTPTDRAGRSRGEEIAAWLAENPIDGWVILDDHRDMGNLVSSLVQTDPAVGLRPVDVALALQRLEVGPPGAL